MVELKIDIGCGSNIRPGYLGMDISSTVGPAFVHDWEDYPWPFDDNSVDALNANHVMEHTKDLIKFINECYRIMKPFTAMDTVTPYYSSIRAWQDPTHIRAISENTFLYFSKKWRIEHGLTHYPIKANFDYKYSFLLSPEWNNKTNEEKNFAIQHYINVVDDIQVTLWKIP